MPTDVYSEFEWRGMVYEGTEGVRDVLAREKVTCYIGFDPTAPSLHVGSLLPLMALARLQRFGHSPIAIAGGGTGMVGDPSGKTQERQLMSLEKIDENLLGIRHQLERFLDFDATPNPARIVNNADWLAKLNLMEFLRDIGKHFTVNGMLARESVRRRIESEDGISFTEFTYSLLQAYDFLMMFDRYRCTLQLGGSDQWGNIVAGADLIRKLRAGKAYGLVMPLVTTASGVKFGKTEAGAVWLDPTLTSDFRFYQFWLNTDDRDAVKYLKFFTFLAEGDVAALERELAAAPEKRVAQRELAREVTRLVRGADAVARAERASAILFGGSLADARADEVLDVFADVPSTEIEAGRFAAPGLAIAELITLTGLAASKGEAARAIKGGGIYLNDGRVADERGRVTLDQAIDGRLFVLRKGQRNRHVVKITHDH
jgi:tyrosyl-tRNA synthetase